MVAVVGGWGMEPELNFPHFPHPFIVRLVGRHLLGRLGNSRPF